jgi:hypothetical protein
VSRSCALFFVFPHTTYRLEFHFSLNQPRSATRPHWWSKWGRASRTPSQSYHGAPSLHASCRCSPAFRSHSMLSSYL